MKHYRIVQNRLLGNNKSQGIFFHFKDNSGYHNFANQNLHINGWVFNKAGNPQTIKIYLCSGGKKLFKEVKDFLISPRVKESFPDYPSEQARFKMIISYKDIAPLLSGSDFSLHLVVSFNDTEHYLENICFIEDNDNSKPIFIVGLGRSGTSILTRSINRALNLKHYGEGHVLPILSKLSSAIDHHFTRSPDAKTTGTIIHDLDRYILIAKTQQVIKKQYQDFFGTQYFVDKTADLPMLETIPYIKKTWPQAKFIFAKRRGIENIASRLQKFPHLPFEKHCQMWRNILNYWRKLKEDKLKLREYLEVDQYDIQTRPTAIAKALGDFLYLKPEQVRIIEQTFIEEQPQMTRDNVREKIRSITEVGWNNEQIKYFRSTCGDAMKEFGYSEGEEYYLKDKK